MADFPILSILLWIFVPLYFRNRITTMPEYLERRYGGQARTLYAYLIVASLRIRELRPGVLYGRVCHRADVGFNRHAAVWTLEP